MILSNVPLYFEQRPSLRPSLKLQAREVVQSLGNGVKALCSIPSVCYIAITDSPDFYDAIRAAISLGGDTDTIAGMVGAIVVAHVGEKRLLSLSSKNDTSLNNEINMAVHHLH